MKEPTQEEIKGFWEWCGFTELHTGKEWNNLFWESPSKDWCYPVPPAIDLNNLFKYAVPALNKKLDRHIDLYQSVHGWVCDIGLGDLEVEDNDPAIALFWAIWGMINERR